MADFIWLHSAGFSLDDSFLAGHPLSGDEVSPVGYRHWQGACNQISLRRKNQGVNGEL